MHPHLLSQAANEHIADLRRTAAARPAQQLPAGRSTIRNRAGWTLVHIGLRLASSSSG
jgi:hypothetical protein